MRRRRHDGWTLVELLVGVALGMVAVGALTAAVGGGLRMLVAAGARAEAEDVVQLAHEALAFDARRAGWDPAAIGIAALTEAAPDRVGFAADVDGDGVIDAASVERVTWVCGAATRRLSRIVGAQSLPVADGVTRCTLGYFDAAGSPMPTPAGGLDAVARAQVRAITLDLALLPRGLASATARQSRVALRTRP